MANTSSDNVWYHGYAIERTEDEQEPCRIRVEKKGSLGGMKAVRSLEPLSSSLAFNWGYPGGTGCQMTADAVLSDALGARISISDYPESPYKRLALDFCEDVVAHFPDEEGEWWLSQDAVLWWVRGWRIGAKFTDIPDAVRTLGPTRDALRRSLVD